MMIAVVDVDADVDADADVVFLLLVSKFRVPKNGGMQVGERWICRWEGRGKSEIQINGRRGSW
jgi:hypothetical protein